MQLWTEYEGHTIDGAFLLEKLLLSEGRSAFFSTKNGNGVPKLIRLIASHFDEEEILARWRGVEALNHPNILKIERYGQIMLDDTTVVYAIFEPVDAALSDVLVSQRLTVPEAKQLALSLASALDVLHKNGFVHEHVDPSKVFAVGEVVKLRGDCIRETPEGQLGQDAKKKDVRDLASVALLSMAQTESLEEATRVSSLPSWLIELVRNTRSGTWGLSQILATLEPPRPVATRPAEKKPPTPITPTASTGPSTTPTPSAASAPSTTPTPRAADTPAPRVSNPPEKPKPIPIASTELRPKAAPIQATPEPAAVSSKFAAPGQRPSLVTEDDDLEYTGSLSLKSMALIGLTVVLVVGLIWFVVHRLSASNNTPQTSSQISAPSVPTPSAPTASPSSATPATTPPKKKPSPTSRLSATVPSTPATGPLPPQQNAGSGSRDQWRVVAFTYNHQDQAQKKADTIAQKHANLHPEVFSPTGRAPFLVTIGGVMNRDQAFAFAQQARRQGLPRDTYAQNYSGKHP